MFLAGFPYKNHYPRFTGAPFHHFRKPLIPTPSVDSGLRAAMFHIAFSESLNMEHNRWLGEEIFASFEREAERHLYYLTLDTRRDRPVPLFDPKEMFPNHHMTAREATY